MGLVIRSAAGNPVACRQCVPVLGALLYGATAAYPIRDGVRLRLSATLFFRKPADVCRANGAHAYMWDLENTVVLLELVGGSARCFNRIARPWVCTWEVRFQFMVLLLRKTTKDSAQSAFSAMESLLYGYITENLGEKPQYMSARIRSCESLLAFLKHGQNEAKFKAYAFDLFVKRGETALNRFFHRLIYAVLNFGDHGEAYGGENVSTKRGGKRNTYTVPQELQGDLKAYFKRTDPTYGRQYLSRTLKAYTALGLIHRNGDPCTLADKSHIKRYLTQHKNCDLAELVQGEGKRRGKQRDALWGNAINQVGGE